MRTLPRAEHQKKQPSEEAAELSLVSPNGPCAGAVGTERPGRPSSVPLPSLAPSSGVTLDIDVSNAFPAPPDVVVRMLVDLEFVRARAVALDHVDLEILEPPGGIEGPQIRYVRSVPVTVPPFAARLLSPRTTIEQHEAWNGPFDDASWSGEWRISARGIPVELEGSAELSAQDTGTRHHISGILRVRLPVVGKRLKPVLLADALQTIGAEHAFGVSWLEDRR